MTRSIPARALLTVLTIGAVVAVAPTTARAGTSEPEPAPTTSGVTDTAADAAGGEPAGPFCASIPPDGEGSFAGMADDPVATAASNNPYLTTLTAAVEAAGLVDTLIGEGPFTIFAPSNEAFAAVPPADLDALLADTDQLTEVLTYHVVVGERLSAADLIAAGSATSASGGALTFTTDADGLVVINGGAATVTCADISTANATVHVIDHVLSPPQPELVDVL